MRIVITGANGFIGYHLSKRLLEDAKIKHLDLVDIADEQMVRNDRTRILKGSFADQSVLEAVFSEPVDRIYHLASVPSGMSEQNPDLGMSVNVSGTLALLNQLRQQNETGGPQAELIFASSIAVYGKPDFDAVTEDSVPTPGLSYGAHKLIGETLVHDYHRRGWIKGCSIRLPGIVMRPPEPNGAVSIFFSDLIRQLSAGREFVCPVSAQARAWLMSVGCCIDNLIHAPETLHHPNTTWVLPAQRVQIAQLVSAIQDITGNQAVSSLIRYEADPWVEENFGSYPPLLTPRAEAAGFRHDGNPGAMVERCLR